MCMLMLNHMHVSCCESLIRYQLIILDGIARSMSTNCMNRIDFYIHSRTVRFLYVGRFICVLPVCICCLVSICWPVYMCVAGLYMLSGFYLLSIWFSSKHWINSTNGDVYLQMMHEVITYTRLMYLIELAVCCRFISHAMLGLLGIVGLWMMMMMMMMMSMMSMM